MCIFGKQQPAAPAPVATTPPPEPPAPPPPAPEAPTPADASTSKNNKASTAPRKAGTGGGFESTILTSAAGIAPEDQAATGKKKLGA